MAAHVHSAYTSISVSVVDTDAKVLSEVLISAASEDPKLNEAFSGDIVLPKSDLFGDEVVLIDRSNSVLTWVELDTTDVRAQLDVGPGFDSNPQDYLQVAKDKAYVTRFAENGDPGMEDFDSGSDVLVIDPSKPEIIGSIDLREAMDEDFPPAAEGLVYAGGQVHVLLSGLASDFSDIAAARIVSIDPEEDEIVNVLKLEDMRNCLSAVLSPSGEHLAVSCTGFFGQDPADGWPDSGVVLLNVGKQLEESATFGADFFQYCEDDECQSAQVTGVAFASDELLAVSTLGAIGAGEDEDISYPAMVFELNLEEEESKLRHEGGAFDIGQPVCFENACLVPDAAGPGVLKFDVEDAELDPGKLQSVDEKTGLPPRHLQRF